MPIARRLFVATLALAATGTAVARDTPEDAFAKLIAGKVAGEPTACIRDFRTQPAQLSAVGDKLVYRVSRDLVYVNQTTGGCESVARGDATISRRPQSQMCRGDILQTFDPVSRFPTGSCALGDFTPYRAPKRSQ